VSDCGKKLFAVVSSVLQVQSMHLPISKGRLPKATSCLSSFVRLDLPIVRIRPTLNTSRIPGDAKKARNLVVESKVSLRCLRRRRRAMRVWRGVRALDRMSWMRLGA
jgi:hypothetical protein